MNHRPLLLAAILTSPLCCVVHARGADDLDVTIRMIDRRDPNVDRFMNRIQLPAGLPDTSADRSDRHSNPSGDNPRKDGSDDSAAAPDRSSDGPGRSDRSNDGSRPTQADIPRPSRDLSDDTRENRRDNSDRSRRRD